MSTLAEQIKDAILQQRDVVENARWEYQNATDGMRESNKAIWSKAAERLKHLNIAAKIVKEFEHP